MDLRFDGRVALVSGGAQGIGLAMAKAFRDSGALVHLVDRDPRVVDQGRALDVPAHVVDPVRPRRFGGPCPGGCRAGRTPSTSWPWRQAASLALRACRSKG